MDLWRSWCARRFEAPKVGVRFLGGPPNKMKFYMLICKHCTKECKNDNSLRNHERCCPRNEHRVYKNGMTGKKGSNQFIVARERGLPTPPGTTKGRPSAFKGKTHSLESRKKISEKLSINNKGGRAKWYEVSGQSVQGTWERDIALKLEEFNIKWIKLKTNRDTIKYNVGGKIRNYTPDFYLPEYNYFIEIKGFWWGDDKAKMNAVIEQNPEIKILIIEHKEFKEILAL